MSSRFGYFPFNRESYLHHLWDFPTHRRIYEQHFGVGLNEREDELPFDSAFGRRHFYLRPRPFDLDAEEPLTSGMSENTSTVSAFHVALDVTQFAPHEISVKTVDSYVVVHGKHEERPDEHGFVSREFTRRYLLPEGVDPVTVTSALSRDGILTVEAPTRKLEPPKPNERIIPIVKLDENQMSAANNDQQK